MPRRHGGGVVLRLMVVRGSARAVGYVRQAAMKTRRPRAPKTPESSTRDGRLKKHDGIGEDRYLPRHRV